MSSSHHEYNTFSDKEQLLPPDLSDVEVANADKPPKKKSSKMVRNLSDFANVFKAFVGSGYTGMPYGFLKSGLLLGVLCIVIVAFITNHCCNMILACKRRVTTLLMEREKSTVETMNEVDYNKRVDEIEKNLSYGDIGHVAIGHVGTKLVNVFVLITQFGFCVLYFIFMGNITTTFFPMKYVTTWDGGNVSDQHQFELPVEQLSFVVRDLATNTTIHSISTTDYNMTTPSTLDTTIPVPHVPTVNSSTIDFWVRQSTAPFFGLLVLIPLPVLILTAFMRDLRHMGSVSILANMTLLSGFFIVVSYLATDIHADHMAAIYAAVGLANWKTFPVFFGQITGAFEGIGTVIPIESSMRENRHKFPPFLLVTLMLIAMILGSIGVLGCLVYGQHVNQIILKNLPPTSVLTIIVNALLFIGVLFTYPLQIFPVIEIVEEMLFLPGKIFGPSFAEMAFAEANNQTNTEEGKNLLSYVASTVDDNEDALKDDDNDEEEDNMVLPVAASIPQQVAAWKRNVLRAFLVVITAGLAIVFKDAFVYITAFTGAIGSAMLAYVLPCLFHLKLHKGTLSTRIIVKDIALMTFGIVGAVVSLTVVILELVDSFKVSPHNSDDPTYMN